MNTQKIHKQIQAVYNIPKRTERKRLPLSDRISLIQMINQTQPVGFGRPATLQEPLDGPDGNRS